MSFSTDVYHGTWFDFDRFDKTADIGFHFGSFRQATQRNFMIFDERADVRRIYRSGGKPRIIKARLRLDNPMVTLDDPRTWTGWHVIDMIRPAIGEVAYREIVDRYARQGKLGVNVVNIAKKALVEAGFDSVVYRNIWEGDARLGKGQSDWSYVAMNPSSIEILDASYVGDDLPVSTPPGILAVENLVANWRRKNGNFRYKRTAMDFRQAVADYVRHNGGSVAESYDLDLDGSINLGGESVQMEVLSRTGRVRLRPVGDAVLHAGRRGFCCNDYGTVQFQGYFDGHFAGLEWQGTETLEGFVERLDSVLEDLALRLNPEAEAYPGMAA